VRGGAAPSPSKKIFLKTIILIDSVPAADSTTGIILPGNSVKHSHVAIFTATVAVNIVTWLCLRLVVNIATANIL